MRSPTSQKLAAAIQSYKGSDWAMVRRLCRQVVAENSASHEAHYLLGLAASRSSDMNSAAECFQRAICLAPTIAEYRLALASLWRSANRLSQAQACLEEALQVAPSDLSLLTAMAAVLRLQNRDQDAIEFYRKAADVAPESAPAQGNFGAALTAAGRIEEALPYLRRAVQLAPDSAEGHNNLGTALEKLNQPVVAAECYRRALSLKPSYAEAAYNLGNALAANKQWEEAIQAYGQAVILRRDFAQAHANLGTALVRVGKPLEALDHLQEAVRLAPQQVEAYCRLSETLLMLNRVPEAVKCSRTAVGIQPGRADAQLQLGLALSTIGEFDEAIACCERAICVAPESVTCLYRAAEVFQRAGMKDRSMAALRQVLELDPTNTAARFSLAAVEGGEVPKSPPPGMIKAVFNPVADSFEQHLVSVLRYCAHDLLADDIFAGGPRAAGEILDIGCGTGLCGARLKSIAGKLHGVDLAPRMVELAGQRGIYDTLEVEDLRVSLARFNSALDVVVAGDVFIYVGDLEEVFALAAKAVRPGGLFGFSLEKHDGSGYVLRPTQRYAHSRQYIEELSGRFGFSDVSWREAAIRKEYEIDVMGWIVVLRKA